MMTVTPALNWAHKNNGEVREYLRAALPRIRRTAKDVNPQNAALIIAEVEKVVNGEKSTYFPSAYPLRQCAKYVEQFFPGGGTVVSVTINDQSYTLFEGSPETLVEVTALIVNGVSIALPPQPPPYHK